MDTQIAQNSSGDRLKAFLLPPKVPIILAVALIVAFIGTGTYVTYKTQTTPIAPTFIPTPPGPAGNILSPSPYIMADRSGMTLRYEVGQYIFIILDGKTYPETVFTYGQNGVLTLLSQPPHPIQVRTTPSEFIKSFKLTTPGIATVSDGNFHVTINAAPQSNLKVM